MEKEILQEIILKLKKRNVMKIGIYPYGELGHYLEHILVNENFEVVLFDKKYDGIIIKNPDKCMEYDGMFFLIATDNPNFREEITSFLLKHDIQPDRLIFMHKEKVCLDDRQNTKIDKSLINRCKKIRTYSDIMVSLTSFPGRIHCVSETIKSILSQSIQPRKIILWLGIEEFPCKDMDIPKDLYKLQNDVFYIRWCKDIKSYKKLVPMLIEYPNAVVVTADDDLIYAPTWLQNLVYTHNKYPRDIICHRITKIIKDNNSKWANIPGGYKYYEGSNYLNKLTGGSGTLYPVGSLYSDVKNQDLFMQLAPTSDDIWFWLMGVMNGTKVRKADKSILELNVNPKAIGTPRLTEVNDSNEKLFWKHFYNILSVYPEIESKLEEEYQSTYN